MLSTLERKTFSTSTSQTTTTTTGHGQEEMSTNRTGTQDSRMEHTVQVVSSTEAGNASTDMCEFHSWTQKNTITSTRRLPFLSAKQTNRHLLLRAQVGANGPLARIRKKAPRQNKAQDLWHGSKTAMSIATGPRFPFLTTYERDTRRRCRNFPAFIPHESHITYSATLSASTNRDRRLTDLVLKDTKTEQVLLS